MSALEDFDETAEERHALEVAYSHRERSYWGNAATCSACFVGRLHTECAS